MAVVSTSFTVKGSKKIIGAINSMAVAIEETGFYGADFDYEEDSSLFEATVENLDLDGLLGWVVIFQTALKENGRNRFSFTVEGIADNDYGSFTAFQIKCTQSMISKKENEFEVTLDEEVADDFNARQEAMWDAEDEAKEALGSVAEVLVSDAEYDSDEYDAANDALAEYFEEME